MNSIESSSATPVIPRLSKPGGAEIRFVRTGGPVRITLSSVGELDELWRDRFDSLTDLQAADLRFHPRVCRLVLRHGVVHLHGIEGATRPPEPSETPQRTLIAYGTSITHGAASTAFHLSYIAQTAWRLGCDLINLGVGGACLAEPAFGDFIAGLAVDMIHPGDLGMIQMGENLATHLRPLIGW